MCYNHPDRYRAEEVNYSHYIKSRAAAQQGGADVFVKFSTAEKAVLAITAAFLLLTAGYFLGQRSDTEPYTVSAQTLWTREITVQEAQNEIEPEPERININTADETQLQSLPGIGEVRAKAIIADREENGPFRIPEDIIRVSGIGQGTLEEILDYITVE